MILQSSFWPLMSHPQPGEGGKAFFDQSFSEKHPREIKPIVNVGKWKVCSG